MRSDDYKRAARATLAALLALFAGAVIAGCGGSSPSTGKSASAGATQSAPDGAALERAARQGASHRQNRDPERESAADKRPGRVNVPPVHVETPSGNGAPSVTGEPEV